MQERFREGNGVSDGIRRHAVVFYPIIATICREFLHYSDPFEVYYMTTMRADVSVCSRSKVATDSDSVSTPALNLSVFTVVCLVIA